MSILINMEMPSSCSMCPMAHRNYRLEAEETQLACYAKGEWVSDDGERPVWCPLIELPPHGRLIDADATVQVFDNSYGGNTIKTTISKFILAHIVGEIPPTVIPADKDGET